MNYQMQQLLRSTFGSLMYVGEFDLVVFFARHKDSNDWVATTITLQGCIFDEDGMESQQDDVNIVHEFQLNPFNIKIGGSM